MRFSILIPVRDDPGNLSRCLESLFTQDLSDCEILVADDGSRPPLVREQPTGEERPYRLFRLSGRGPAAARNVLAEQARGEYLFFLDADTLASPDLLACARATIARHPGIASFFGSYDDEPEWRSLVSLYRNLLHHHVHQQSAGRDVSTFWCGCGVVRRADYLESGGLPEAFRTPAIEDVAFGMRLSDRGIATRIVPELQVKHLKRWTLGSWLYTDLFRRGIPWVRLMRARREWTGQLNFAGSQRAAAVAAVATVVLTAMAAWQPEAAVLALVPLATFIYLNRGFFALLRRKRGLPFAAAAVPLHLTYALVCVASVAIGLLAPALTLEYRRRAPESDATRPIQSAPQARPSNTA